VTMEWLGVLLVRTNRGSQVDCQQRAMQTHQRLGWVLNRCARSLKKWAASCTRQERWYLRRWATEPCWDALTEAGAYPAGRRKDGRVCQYSWVLAGYSVTWSVKFTGLSARWSASTVLLYFGAQVWKPADELPCPVLLWVT
jgi:hypothetical protein